MNTPFEHAFKTIGLFMLVIALSMSGCGGGGDGTRFLGKWQGKAYAMDITKDGDLFVVNVTKTSGFEGLQGKYTAKLVNDSLQLNPSMLGEVTLSADSSKIYWHGDEWQRR